MLQKLQVHIDCYARCSISELVGKINYQDENGVERQGKLSENDLEVERNGSGGA